MGTVRPLEKQTALTKGLFSLIAGGSSPDTGKCKKCNPHELCVGSHFHVVKCSFYFQENVLLVCVCRKWNKQLVALFTNFLQLMSLRLSANSLNLEVF